MTDSLVQSLQIVVLGMGFVFAFLTLLVGCVGLMSKMFAPSESDSPAAAAGAPAQPMAAAGADDDPMNDPELVSVIASVIHRYRASKNQQP